MARDLKVVVAKKTAPSLYRLRTLNLVRKMTSGLPCTRHLSLATIVAAMLFFTSALLAQSALHTSKRADFATGDKEFTFQDTLFVKVVFPGADYLAVEKSKYELKAENSEEDEELEGSLINNFDGTYTQAIPLSGLNRLYAAWELKVEVEDEFDREFEARAELTIRTDIKLTGDEVSFSGIISDVTSSALHIPAQTFLVDDETQVLDKDNNKRLDHTRLKPGWGVKVLAEKLQSGELKAKKIEVISKPGETEVEFDARINELNSEIINVGGAVFYLTDELEVKDMDGREGSIDLLRAGMLVKIEGTWEDGRLIARDIHIRNKHYAEQDINISGNLVQFEGDGSLPDTLWIRETAYLVDANSRFYGFSGEQLEFSALRSGETVEMLGRTHAEGLSSVVSLKRTRKFISEVVVSGKISEIADTHFWLNNMVRIQRDALTLVYDSVFSFVDATALRAGQAVEVYADERNSVLFARKVLINDETPELITLKDVITEIGSASLVVADILFLVSDETQIFDRHGRPTSFDQLEVRNSVLITGQKIDGEYHALHIELRGTDADELIWSGVVDELSGSVIRVSGKSFTRTPATEFVSPSAGVHVMDTDFIPGTMVMVTAERGENTLYARRVEMRSSLDEELVIDGEIGQVAGDQIMVFGQPVVLSTTTALIDVDGRPLSQTELVAGVPVRIRGRRVEEETVYGWRVQRLAASPDTVTVTGPVTINTSGSFAKIGRLRFFLSEAIAIRNSAGQPIRLGDIATGTVVTISAVNVSNNLVAHAIHLLDRIVLTGRVEDVTSNGLTVAGENFTFAGDILVLDTSGKPADLNSVQKGFEVRVTADQHAGFPGTAQRIRVIRDDVITSVRDGISDAPGDVLPQYIVLSQSYPNPVTTSRLHSAGTRIRFTLSQPAEVTLRVFNILGQEVATLLQNRRVGPGGHEMSWNGLDRSGRLAGPGVYFFHMQAGGKTAVQRFIILR